LQLAASESEEKVELALREMIEGGEMISAEKVTTAVRRKADQALRPGQLVEVKSVALESYDALLGSQTEVEEVV
jgi:hypothetical protein